MKVVNEFVHVVETPEQIRAEEEQPMLTEWQVVRSTNGKDSEH
jgi:hypothetical protein